MRYSGVARNRFRGSRSCRPMSKLDVFCERCGTRQPADPPRPGSRFSRMLDAVGLTVPDSPQHEPFLRLCFTCRGYSCPACWNDGAGACQTCEPLPEPVAVASPEPFYSATDSPHVDMSTWPTTPDELPGEPAVEPEPVAAAQLEAEPEAATEPEPEPEPIFTVDPAPEPVAAAELEAEPEAAIEPEPEPEPIFTVDPAPEPVAVAEVEPEIDYQPESVPPPPPLSPLLPGNPFGSVRPVAPPPVPPRIEFEVPPPPPAFMIDRQRRAPLLPPPVPRAAMEAAQALPQTKHCSQCQLPLSARANFCRRCGSSQSASA